VPITILQPGADEYAGPGFLFDAGTDQIGPWPTTAFWRVELWAGTDREQLISAIDYASQSWEHNGIIGATTDLQLQIDANHSSVHDGQPARVVVQHWQDSTTMLEQASQDVTLDMTTGVPHLLQYAPPAPAGEGLTEEQAAQLQAVAEATVVPMGLPGTLTNVPLGSLLVHPPLGLTRVDATPICRTGDGYLEGDSGLFPSIYGLWWEFTVVPPGVGTEAGATVLYEQRMVQLQTVHTINGLDVVTEIVEANYDRVVWLWAEAKPTRIEYAILPGVEVCFHYVRPFVP
jgi:hypothetical protein